MSKQRKGQKCPKPKKNRKPVVQHLPLPKYHKCYGCVWYPRDVDILYCPFQSCVRHKNGFGIANKPDES